LGHISLGMLIGSLQGEVPGGFLLKQPPISKEYLQGAAIALIVSGLVNGGAAIVGGGEGTALCGTGVGCLAGGPLIATSLVVGANAIGDVYTGVQTWKDSSNQMSAEEGSPSDEAKGDATPTQADTASAATVPEKATKTLGTIDETGAPPAGYKGGRPFANDGRNNGQKLDATASDGTPITYQEWDVNPYTPGGNRGAERIVTGSDGSAHYTADHYGTFVRIR
jgi:guanyl-specific ribonuclease Sa